MKVNELLLEYISRETFSTLVKKACLKHGIKTGVRTNTEFDHDTGTLMGTIVIKIPDATYAEGKYVDIDFGKFNQQVIKDIVAALKPYSVTSFVKPASRYYIDKRKKVPLDSELDLATLVQSGPEVEFRVIFGSEGKTDFDDVFATEKATLEKMIANWQKSMPLIGKFDDAEKWIDWQSVGTPGMSLMPNFEKGLLQRDQSAALKGMTDDPEMLKAIQDRHDKKIGPKRARRFEQIEKQKDEMLPSLKELVAKFNVTSKASKAVLTVVKTPVNPEGHPVNKHSVRYYPGEEVAEVPQIKVSLRKDMTKFEKS